MTDVDERTLRRRRRRVATGVVIISALVLGVAALTFVGEDDPSPEETVDDPTLHVHLLPDGGSSAEVMVSADGRLGPVLEVTATGTAALLSATAGDEPLPQGQRPMLIPADAEPEDLDAPIGETPSGIPHSAWWRVHPEASIDHLWFFLPEAQAQPYQLVVPSELAGAALTLELHPVDEPARDDLVGSWELVGSGSTLRFEADGELDIEGPNPEIEDKRTWDYTEGELWWASGEDTRDVYRATLLPDGQLALVATDAERVLGPPRGKMSVLRPVES